MLAIQLSVGLAVDGKPVQVDFIGGANGLQKIKPTFITSDPVLQEALEKSGAMNVHYFLESTEEIAEENPFPPYVPTIPEPPQAPTPPDQATGDAPNIFGDEGETEEPKETPIANENQSFGGIVPADVTNSQDAKAYLMARFPGQTAQMPNKPAIINEANRLGVNFPNWK